MASKGYFKALDRIKELESKYKTDDLSNIPDTDLKEVGKLLGATFKDRKKKKPVESPLKYEFYDLENNLICRVPSLEKMPNYVKPLFRQAGKIGYSPATLRRCFLEKEGKTPVGVIKEIKN